MVSPSPQSALQPDQDAAADVSKPQTHATVHRITQRLSSAPFQPGSRAINVTLLGPGRGLPRHSAHHNTGILESPIFLPIGLVRLVSNSDWLGVSEKHARD